MTSDNQPLREGHCACGAARYQMAGNPMFVHCCHCTSCQRETGTAFALNAMIETDRVTLLQGTVETVKTPSESGMGQKVVRCTDCKVALWSHYGGAGDAVMFIRVGTLETPSDIAPDIHIFTDSKQPWVTWPNDIPSVPKYYDRKEYWSPDRLARRQAIE